MTQLRLLLALTTAGLLASACKTSGGKSGGGHAESGAVAIAFNEKLTEIGFNEDKFFTLKTSRTAAMMHLAMHDAVNAVDRQYESYALTKEAPNADPLAAAAQAAYDVAVAAYPDKEADFKAILDAHLGPIADSPKKAEGIALGKEAALAVIEKRKDDNWAGEAKYEFKPAGPGVYQTYPPHGTPPGPGFVFGASWAVVKPFAMTSSDQFRPGPPPDLKSEGYAKDFNEVKDVGSAASTTRTEDQTHYAVWWKEFCDGLANRIARKVATEKKSDLWETSRALAQLNMAIYDGYNSVWEAKMHYNHWRPWTAIRAAKDDGNDKTEPDANWENLDKFTPPFPTYPSAHTTDCAATMTVLAKNFGDETPFSVASMVAPETGAKERSFKSFSAAAEECGNSRVYLGYHFRYDVAAAMEEGKGIGNYISDNYLKPAK